MEDHQDERTGPPSYEADSATTFQPRGEEAPWDLFNVYQYLEGRCKEDRASLFPVEPSTRTRGSGDQVQHKRCPLSTKKFCAA